MNFVSISKLKIRKTVKGAIFTIFLLLCTSMQAEMGFYTLDSEFIPDAVRESAKSVYKIVFIDGDFDLIEGLNNTQSMLDGLKGDLDDPDSFPRITDFVIAMQLDFCIKQNLDPCVYAKSKLYSASATAFLAEAADSLWTNMHNLDGQTSTYMDWCQKSNDFETCLSMLKDRPLFFALYDKDQDRLFSAREGDVAKVSHAPEFASTYVPGALKIENRSKITIWDQISDFIEIKLSKEVGTPLKFVDETSSIGRTGFVLGYPAQTENRMDLFGKPDAPGEEFRVSFGKIISFYEAQDAVGRPFPKTEFYDNFDRYYVNVFADTMFGNSGGPIVNENGDVLAILSESNFSPELEEPSMVMGLSIHRVFSNRD